MEILKLREHGDLETEAALWFHSKWGVPVEEYRRSIEECMTGAGSVPQYRKDLMPNVCALYVEESYRCRGIAGELLQYVREDMRAFGIETLYLITDHAGFYERYGWKFLCMVQGDGEPDLTRMYVYYSSQQVGRQD